MSIQILEDEIDKKRRQLADQGVREHRAPFLPTAVKNQKPGRVYRGAYNDPRRIAELSAQGYTLCKDKGKEAEQFSVDEQKPDGTHVYKDVILMSCDQAEYIARHAAYRNEADDMSTRMRQKARERINELLVDEGGAPAGRDYTTDESHQGETKFFTEDN